jgi:protocatechuate 3,4-dioxygenase, beta subunit
MKRRTFLVALPAITGALAAAATEAASAQDVEYLRAVERAQQLRPRTLSSRARIAPIGEPGTPLVISGHLFQADGRTPAAGYTVFAYHTDAQGIYDLPSHGPHSWRLKGWALTDAEGRFEFTTIRPAPYPRRTEAAHVHVTFEGPDLPRRSAGIQFADDPLVTREDRALSSKAGRFGSVLAVTTEQGIQHVEWNVRTTDAG